MSLRLLLSALWLALSLAQPARAVLIDEQPPGNGSGNTSAPPNDPGWDHVGFRGATVVYLGNGWILTARHVAFGDPNIGGVVYPAVAGSRVLLGASGSSTADLAVWRIDPSPDLPILEIRATPPGVGDLVTMIGRGKNRGPASSWGSGGWEWASGNKLRWGTNQVHEVDVPLDLGFPTATFTTEFTQNFSDHEAQAATGDSGGAVFAQNASGQWELAGTMIAIDVWPGQPEETAIYGNLTFAADLSVYRDEIISIVRPACSNEQDDDGDGQIDGDDPDCTGPEDLSELRDCSDGIDNDGDELVDMQDDGCASPNDPSEYPDQDGDGLDDPDDNCVEVANPDQYDSNLDGYGNACDADYTGDGAIGIPDLSVFGATFNRVLGDPAYDPDADHNGDAAVGIPDFAVFSGAFNGAPGPSGLGCAGTIPCPAP